MCQRSKQRQVLFLHRHELQRDRLPGGRTPQDPIPTLAPDLAFLPFWMAALFFHTLVFQNPVVLSRVEC